MTHNWERTHWLKEGAYGLGAGLMYGLTSVTVGHPFDTVKTKMQAQDGFDRGGMVRAFTKTLRSEGVVGLYRGCVPPLWGSSIFRSIQFAVYEAAYTKMASHPSLTRQIPGTRGLEPRVLLGGCLGAVSRAVIETPLEYAKVRRQTGQSWQLSRVYTGFSITLLRTGGLMTTYFVILDYYRRKLPQFFNTPIFGPLVMSGSAATMCWWLVWPLEVVKSKVQAGYHGSSTSITQRMSEVVRTEGVRALYRGILPGSIRSFFANGISMIVMQTVQRKVTHWGLRD